LRENLADQRENALSDFRIALRLMNRERREGDDRARLAAEGAIAYLQGDYAQSARLHLQGAEIPARVSQLTPHAFQLRTTISLARQHDGRAVREKLRQPEWQWFSHFVPVGLQAEIVLVHEALENWTAIAALEKPTGNLVFYWAKQYPENVAVLARAKAELGDLNGAQALIALTTGKCDSCLITRARIAEMKGDHARADWWFARAEAHAPSTPFSDTAWGQTLLERGESAAAIKKLAMAHTKGPLFADPLELWGEALMKQNRSHLALAKFSEAERYAPNWKRLHMKWGEALAYAGKKAEAQKHLLRATRLEL
jgi:tetratricopeptide (TPR) repeat protein